MARKTGLGRGLGALIPEGEPTEITESATTIVGPLQEIALSSIRPNQFQPRQSFEDEPLKALAESIKGVGVIQPILVRPVEGESGVFEIVAGERRWRASRLAGLAAIPAFVQTDVNDTLSLERAIVENLHRDPRRLGAPENYMELSVVILGQAQWIDYDLQSSRSNRSHRTARGQTVVRGQSRRGATAAIGQRVSHHDTAVRPHRRAAVRSRSTAHYQRLR